MYHNHLNIIKYNNLTYLMHFNDCRFRMTQNTNNTFSVRSVLEKEKLTGTNFLDWARNLRIVLRQERKIHVIENPPPVAPTAGAPTALRTAYQRHMDDATDVACLMLATMSAELQKQHEHMDAYVMFEHLGTMFQEQARQEKYNTSKDTLRMQARQYSSWGACS